MPPKLNSLQQTISDLSSPETTRVLLYGWTGSAKVRLQVDANGVVQTAASSTASQIVIQPSPSSLQMQVGGGSLSAYQGGTWNVGANGGSLMAFQPSTWFVSSLAGGTISATQGTTPWTVYISSLVSIPAGTNMLGQVNVSSMVSIPAGTNMIGQVNASSLAARSFTVDTISVMQDVGRIVSSLTAVAPSYAVINVATAGDNAIIASTTNKRIVVLDYVLVVGTGGDQVTFKDGLAGTAITGPMRFAANGGTSAGYSPVGHFRSALGASLTLNSSLGSQISGHITYVVV